MIEIIHVLINQILQTMYVFDLPKRLIIPVFEYLIKPNPHPIVKLLECIKNECSFVLNKIIHVLTSDRNG